MKNPDSVLAKLRTKGYKLTPQRVAVVKYLMNNKEHPTADLIYRKLRKKYPMVSFSTVYNTLEILQEIDEIKELTISQKSAHFDPKTEPHHHFFCETCGKVRDVLQNVDIPSQWIENHRLSSYQIYFYGICSECLKMKKKEVLK
jgi:Fur family peroxide stress response transcriptional regulator